ncbi:MAG: SLC26A/SulP transporter family protein, partial [Anaerolineales bacterium]|nr:SLC26A/SulP transporter family protein [Anaerolineales bacterium]
GTIMLLSAVALLLNASGIEETARREVSLNRELWAAGMGNVAAGLVGGLVGYQQMGLSALSLQAGAGSRLTGVVMAGVCVLALVGGTAVLALFPKVILGGLLLYLGLSFLKEWVVDSWARLPRVEYGIILFILAVIAGVGFLEGIAVGIIAAVVLFVVAYSRIDVVRYELTGAHAASRVTRSPRARQRLRQMGDCLVVLRLQGFVFFGTADRLLHHVQQRLEADAAGTVRYVALDFQRISGLDSTAIRSLRKLQQHVLARRGTLLIAGTDPGFCDRLARGGLREGVHYFTDLDRALEWYENEVLGQESLAVETADSLLHQLTALLPAEIEPATLLRYLERREIAPGDVLLRQGEAPDSLFFVESGQVTAQLVYADRPAMRLETMGGGRVVGELGFYLGQVRTASVVADTPGTVYRLTRAALARMEQETPAAAAALHRLIVQLLAERVTHLVNSVDALARWP